MNGLAIENSCITKYVDQVVNTIFNQSCNRIRGPFTLLVLY